MVVDVTGPTRLWGSPARVEAVERHSGGIWFLNLVTEEGEFLEVPFDPTIEALPQTLESASVSVSPNDLRRITQVIWPPSLRQTVVKSPRQFKPLLEEVLGVLVAQNDPEPFLFRRGNYIVHVMSDENGEPVLYDVDRAWAMTHIGTSMDWVRATQNGPIDCSPDQGVATALTTEGDWPFPPLVGVVRAPILRRDGSILQREGYDRATGLLYRRPPGLSVAVPENPTQAEIHDALALLNDLVYDFPFRTRADKVNSLALLLTPLVRQIVSVVPLALVTGSQPGSGKGLLTQCVAIIHTGTVQGISPFPNDNEDEARKTISARLLGGSTFIVWDNVRHLESDILKAVLTAPSFNDRQLQFSKVHEMPNRATWVATGNNISLDREMTRRSFEIYLEPHEPHPEARQTDQFRHPQLLEWTSENRGQLLSSLLTLVRAWVMAGRPEWTVRSMGSFEQWTGVVGGILSVAGLDSDFLANMEELWADAEEDATEEIEFAEEVYRRFGDGWWTAKDLVVAMVPLPWDMAKGATHVEQVGRTLGQHRGAVIGRWKLRRGKKAAGDTRPMQWKLERRA
ncbi:MAG: hypothetical protein ACJ76P_12975 [Actinomycetota bacterium]